MMVIKEPRDEMMSNTSGMNPAWIIQHRTIDSVDDPRIARVKGFEQAFEALNRSQVTLAVMPAIPFAYQSEIEEFNNDARSVYVVVSGRVENIETKLDAELKKKGLKDSKVRHAFTNYIYQIVRYYVGRRGLRPGQWDLTVASTMEEHTKQEEWHVDNFDVSATKWQLSGTLAGEGGMLVALPEHYDRRRFEQLRSQRRTLESERKATPPLPKSFFYDPNREQEALVKVQRETNVRAMEELLADTRGIALRADQMGIMKGGEMPHSSPVSDDRRLIMMLVEFDEFLDETIPTR